MIIKNSTVTREQYDSLQSDLDMTMETLKKSSAWRRAKEKSLIRALKIRDRWIIALATVLLMQSIAIIYVALVI